VFYSIAALTLLLGDIPDFNQEIIRKEKELTVVFKEEKSWKNDAAGRGRVLPALQAARPIKAKALAPLLASHLDYTPYDDNLRLRERNDRYPVCPVLVDIGIPAVPALLEVLKRSDPADLDRGGLLTHNLAVSCLREIYEQGGFGPALARQRIELEMAKADPKEAKYLREALQHSQLKKP